MSEDITFYTNPMSRGRIVRWMLEEIGQPYLTEIIDYQTTMKSPGYLAINPMGKVPAIQHRGQIVTECAAICAYLADAFPEAGLAPRSGSADRAPYYRWLFFAAGPLEAAVTDAMLGVHVPAERRRMVGYGSLDAVLNALERLVSGKNYIAGGRFSAADLYVGAHLSWGMTLGTIPRRQAFATYTTRLDARPAAVRARQIDDELLASGQR